MLATHDWGSAGDVPFVFWHALGAGQSGEHVAALAPALTGSGFHVVGVDGPGFGGSPLLPRDEYRLERLAALLGDVLDDQGLDRPVLAGHSWGGGVALAYAAARPDDVRALVLFDSGHIDYLDVEDVDPETLPDDAQGRAMRGLLARMSDYWPVVAEHGIPTLLLLATEPPHGDVNRAHADRFRAAVPHAEVRWVEGAGHGIIEDAGAPLGEDLAAWLVDQGL